VALSLTEPDIGLLRYARIVAKASCCEQMRFVHVIPAETTEPSGGQAEDARRQMRSEIETHFGPSDIELQIDVVHGARLDQLLATAVAHQCDVIVLGHRKRRSGQRSLARRLAMVAPCSVWLVPEGSPERLNELLVPVDFSSHSADALSLATSLASARGLRRVLALHVFFDPSSVRYEEHIVEVRGREEAALEQFLSNVDRHGVAVDGIFEESTHPPQAILRVAARHEADLLVMNTRGRSRASAILLGSITSKTMEETKIPLLAVKHFGSRMSVLEALLHHRHWEGGSPKSN
jgi:nucleotide-binding universal stress UspA family protein